MREISVCFKREREAEAIVSQIRVFPIRENIIFACMEDAIKKITVFGGTGMLGKPVVRELVRAGYDVTVMVRDTGRAASTLPEKVTLKEGDLTRKKDIMAVLEEADAVYLNLSTRPDVKKYDSFIPERDGLESVLSVIAEINSRGAIRGSTQEPEVNGSGPKIKRVASISSLVQRYQGTEGFSWWVFEIKQWAEKMLKEADVPVTIFYPSSFMETMDQGGILQGRRLMLVGTSREPMHFIAASDYGRMVARAFKLHDRSDQFYDIQGTQALTMEDAALEFVKNYRHGPLKITRVPMWVIKVLGGFNGEVNYLAHFMEALNKYKEPKPDPSVWEKLGRPRTSLAEYARRL